MRSTPSITPWPQHGWKKAGCTFQSRSRAFGSPEPAGHPHWRPATSQGCVRTGHTALPWVPGKPTGSLFPSVPSPLTHCRSVSLLDHQNPSEPTLLSPSWGAEAQPYRTQRLAAIRGAQRRRKERNTVTFSMSLSSCAGSYRSGLSPVFVFEHMHVFLCAG